MGNFEKAKIQASRVEKKDWADMKTKYGSKKQEELKIVNLIDK